MIGAAQGFPVTLCMPENVSVERKRILHAYGANIIYTDPADGSDGAIRAARELHAKHPGKYFYADQYSNDANWQAHYHGTANEIWQQTEGRITHFVSMMGTSGTFVGTTRRLKELNPRDPLHLAPARLAVPRNRRSEAHGQRHRPQNLRPSLADENLGISTEDAYAMAKRLAREEGLAGRDLGGRRGCRLSASGAASSAKGERAVFVTILCDSGDKYLSERFWEQE